MFDNMFSKAIKSPEFPSDFNWINTTDSLSLEKLRGHVVILDFWTYCCINCMHTLPVLAHFERKYQDKPVVFIGVHSAKFFNEQDKNNIEQAVGRYEITHPVLVDREMSVWRQYRVSGWPTIVIIDPIGNLVYRQSGEGQKEMIEDIVDTLLEKHERNHTLAREPIKITRTYSKNNAILSYPGKISIANGKIAISDSNHNRIIISDLSGKIEKTIGSGIAGLIDGSFSEARFFRPHGVVWINNRIVVADTENHALREIDLDKNKVTTLAGNGKQGQWASAGGKGSDVSLSSPWDVTVKDDQVFITMAGNHQIWTCDLKSNFVKPFAGNGYEDIIDGPRMQAQLAQPSGITIYNDLVYFVDSETSSVRKIDLKTDHVQTIVGHGLFTFGHKDGNTNEALLQHPLGISAKSNRIFVADTYNSAIRMIDLEKQNVSTLIGKNGTAGICRTDDPECDTLGLYEPSDIKIHDEKLYIADTNNHLIRVYDLKTNLLTTLNIR